MSNWYHVVKTIKGHRYVYLQQTYREGVHVRTRNRYLGPAGGETGASGSSGGKSKPAGMPSGIAAAVVGGLAELGKGAAKQFDAARWGTDAAAQIGLVNAPAYPKKKRVTTTKRRRATQQTTGKAPFFDTQDLSPSGGIQTGAVEKVFARIPDGTTDPGTCCGRPASSASFKAIYHGSIVYAFNTA
jgi:hypothetical protein